MKGKEKHHLLNAARQLQKKVMWRIHERGAYFKNPERKRSWVTAGKQSTSTARPNRYERKTMTVLNLKDVIYYELLKPSETILNATDNK
ncbi:hypothetical protein CDAR_225581 [Caerostris darwini]|uniref:Uncharacterized protein n=1 Tax=Caerostris darwini TaxID=1538125 RepID=A0AAV4QVX4_9ARAC|nr:hypothetical protein CDAR_225581 [Caerostris darwini]